MNSKLYTNNSHRTFNQEKERIYIYIERERSIYKIRSTVLLGSKRVKLQQMRITDGDLMILPLLNKTYSKTNMEGNRRRGYTRLFLS